MSDKTKQVKTTGRPNYWYSLFAFHCPRCRRGSMFQHAHAYEKLRLSHILQMPETCSVCNLKFEREPGFWYGTGYVSYALAIAISVATFVAWIVLIGIGLNDQRWLWWLGCNTLFLVLLQPWLMRLSRVVYLYFFVRYNPEYDVSNTHK